MTHPTDALRLVPVEPTPDMLNAAVDATDAGSGMSWSNRSPQSLFQAGYEAMLAAAPASPLPEGGGQCSGISGELKSPDLDALEKLADHAEYCDMDAAVPPATIKALIAEVRSLRTRVARWEPPMMTSTASSPCSAFLARNGKGEG